MSRFLMLLMLVAVAVALPYPQDAQEVAPAVPAEGESVDARHHYHRRPYGGYGGYNNYGGYSGYNGYNNYNNYGYNRYPSYGGHYGGLWREGQKPSADGAAPQPEGPGADSAPAPLADAAPGAVSFE